MFDFLKKKFNEVKEKIIGKAAEKVAKEQPEKQITVEPTQKIKIEANKPKRKEKKTSIVTEIKKAIVGKVKLSEKEIDEFIVDFELSLLEADVAVEVSEKICSDLKSSLTNKEFSRNEEIEKTIEDSFRRTLDKILSENKTIDLIKKAGEKKPLILLFVGPNGAGKTTTIAKICSMFLENKFMCVFAAGDTFRAASIEQLQEHADKLGVKVIKQKYGADPTAVAFDAVKYAQANNIDVVLIDSAGRQETNVNLVEQIKKMNRVIKPDMKIFIGEAQTGNAIIDQIKAYSESIGLDGAILSKLDLDVKGGGILSIVYNKIPVLYFGTGQKYGDIKKFDKEFLVKNIFG